MRIARLLPVALLCVTSFASAEDWPQWRGPAGQGIASDRPTPTHWSETENIAWKTPLHGRAWSSPVILGNEIWLTTAEEKPDTPENTERRLKANTGNQPLNLVGEVSYFALCLDKETGKLLRDVPLLTVREPQWVHRMNSYASPTPILEPGRMYCHFGSEGTVCLDTKSGKVLWTSQEHKVMHENGPGSTPVIEGDLLIFHCEGSDRQFLAALNKHTGKTVWRTDRTGTTDTNPQLKKSYGTPLTVESGGRRMLMSPGPNWLYGYDPLTGRELFKLPYDRLGFSIGARPVAGHGMLYFSTGFMQAEMVAVRYETGTPEIAWRETRSVPRTPSPLVLGDQLYMVSDDGGIVTCLNAQTGKVIFRERIQGSHWSSPIYAGGHLYFCDRDGGTTVIAPGDKLNVVARNQLTGTIMASPAAVDGKLFIRTEHALYCIAQADPPMAQPSESTSMFNGKDFTGWRFTGDVTNPANWKVTDGVIQVTGGGNPHLATEREYSDFEMKFEWRGLAEKYNSGFFIRSGRNLGSNQLNLAKGSEGAFIGGKLEGAKAVGNLQKPPREWNEWRVLVQGDKVSFWCNGQLAWEGTGLKPEKGYIGLQAEGAALEFRNLQIREIK